MLSGVCFLQFSQYCDQLYGQLNAFGFLRRRQRVRRIARVRPCGSDGAREKKSEGTGRGKGIEIGRAHV